MRIGIIGTGAMSEKSAGAYKSIGYELVACTALDPKKGREFAHLHGMKFIPTVEGLCSRQDIDFIDVSAPPSFRLEPVELCAKHHKHVLVQKPIATTLDTAQKMIETAREAGIQLGVVSQHRFDDSVLFLKRALAKGALGKLLQADAYIKWYRSPQYYGRPFKGSWAGEGGGALITQAIHQADLLLHLAGAVKEVFGFWQLHALHRIESEDVVNAVLRYTSSATGVIQASTAFWPGYSERLEFHGTMGTAIITGDRLTTWQVQENYDQPVPLADEIATGASEPMAISIVPLARQFLAFGETCRSGKTNLSSAMDGYRALQLVLGIYESCKQRRLLAIENDVGATMT